jgi:proline dehydrogenase
LNGKGAKQHRIDEQNPPASPHPANLSIVDALNDLAVVILIMALQNMTDIREVFRDYAKILFDQTSFPRIATHDDELIGWVKQYTRENNIPEELFELQMLYGLREETMERFAKEGYNARVYVHCGTMWFLYFKRRLMERKENIWFVLSTMVKK